MPSDLLELPSPDWPSRGPSPPDDETLLIVGARLSDWMPGDDERAARHLSADEQRRAARFRFLDDVRRHLLGRLLVRTTIGRWTDRAPADLRIDTDAYEKPCLSDLPFQFNVSHGGDHVVAAFAREHSIGIDVEPRERKGDEGLAKSVTTADEFQRWRNCPPDARARWFMHLWTTKESLIKATGEGLYRDPTTIDCRFNGFQITGFRCLEPTDTDVDGGRPGDWHPRPFDIGNDGVACVTSRIAEPTTSFVRYVPPGEL
ncbi:MAG: 4'-phosphopantetheinyl transferase superfamily protein, partial [Bradymonadaceae bacterium]